MEKIPPTPELWQKLERDYVATTDDAVHFLDPITKEPLRFGEIPPSLYESSTLAEGIDYLQIAGSVDRLGINLILSYHGQPQDFLDTAAQYGNELASAPFVAIETSPADSLIHAVLPGVKLSNEEGRQSFQRAQLQWLLEHGCRIIPTEYAEDDKLSERMQNLWGIYETATKNADGLDDAWRNKIRATATGAYQAVRQWTLLANCGAWLSKLELAGELPEDRFQLPFMLGSWHTLSEGRLQDALNVNTTTNIVRHAQNPAGYDDYASTFLDMLAYNRATSDQLAIPLAW